MKKKFVALFLLTALLLTACATPAPDIPTFVLDTSNVSNLDTANTFLMNYNFEHMTQSEQVIYKLYPPKILDGLVIDTRQNEDNKRVATVKTLSGETVYEGLLFPNGIPEMEAELDLNTCNYGEVGGTGSLIAFYMGADGNGTKPAEYIVYLDTAQNMKPVYIFPC